MRKFQVLKSVVTEEDLIILDNFDMSKNVTDYNSYYSVPHIDINGNGHFIYNTRKPLFTLSSINTTSYFYKLGVVGEISLTSHGDADKYVGGFVTSAEYGVDFQYCISAVNININYTRADDSNRYDWFGGFIGKATTVSFKYCQSIGDINLCDTLNPSQVYAGGFIGNAPLSRV